jgi:U3 small nucleolar RNA-associated protein 18
MVKHARKRQKTSKSAKRIQPLGSQVSITDDASKDDEERRLESLLFGTPFVSSRKDNTHVLVLSDAEEDEAPVVDGKELEHFMDTDVRLNYYHGLWTLKYIFKKALLC